MLLQELGQVLLQCAEIGCPSWLLLCLLSCTDMLLLGIRAIAEAWLRCECLQKGCQICALQLRQHLWAVLLRLLLLLGALGMRLCMLLLAMWMVAGLGRRLTCLMEGGLLIVCMLL